jgi:putative membrane protein
MRVIIHWLFSAFVLLGIAYFLPGVEVSGIYIALITALLLGLVNAIIRPILLVLTLPINILTLGLFTWVINGLLFWFVASFVAGFSVAGFWNAVLGALILSAGSWLINKLLED